MVDARTAQCEAPQCRRPAVDGKAGIKPRYCLQHSSKGTARGVGPSVSPGTTTSSPSLDEDLFLGNSARTGESDVEQLQPSAERWGRYSRVEHGSTETPRGVCGLRVDDDTASGSGARGLSTIMGSHADLLRPPCRVPQALSKSPVSFPRAVLSTKLGVEEIPGETWSSWRMSHPNDSRGSLGAGGSLQEVSASLDRAPFLRKTSREVPLQVDDQGSAGVLHDVESFTASPHSGSLNPTFFEDDESTSESETAVGAVPPTMTRSCSGLPIYAFGSKGSAYSRLAAGFHGGNDVPRDEVSGRNAPRDTADGNHRWRCWSPAPGSSTMPFESSAGVLTGPGGHMSGLLAPRAAPGIVKGNMVNTSVNAVSTHGFVDESASPRDASIDFVAKGAVDESPFQSRTRGRAEHNRLPVAEDEADDDWLHDLVQDAMSRTGALSELSQLSQLPEPLPGSFAGGGVGPEHDSAFPRGSVVQTHLPRCSTQRQPVFWVEEQPSREQGASTLARHQTEGVGTGWNAVMQTVSLPSTGEVGLYDAR